MRRDDVASTSIRRHFGHQVPAEYIQRLDDADETLFQRYAPASMVLTEYPAKSTDQVHVRDHFLLCPITIGMPHKPFHTTKIVNVPDSKQS